MTAVITKASATATHGKWMHALRLAKLVQTRPVLPVLANMLIEADDDQLGCVSSTFDLEQSVRVQLRGDQLACEGRFLLPIHAAWDAVRALPGSMTAKKAAGEPVTITDEPEHVVIAGFGRELRIEKVGQIDDMPALPPGRGALLARVHSSALQRAWRFAGTAAGADKTLPMLTGVLARFDTHNRMELAATDRYRLTVVTLPVERLRARDKADLLIPNRITRALNLLDGEVSIRIGDGGNLAVFSTPTVRITSLLIESNFPTYRSLIPDEGAYLGWWTVERKPLIDDVKAVAATKDRNQPVQVLVEPDAITVVGCQPRPASLNGTYDERFTTAFNPNFLLDALNGFDGRTVNFGFTSPVKPAVLEGDVALDDMSATHLLMPVRIPG